MPVLEIKTSQGASAPHSTRAVTTDMLDLEVLRALEKIKSDDGSDLVSELIDLYLQSTSQSIVAMRKAAEEGEWVVLKRTVHTLKGSSSTLGLRQITKVCQDLETALSSPSDDVQTLIGLLERNFLEVKPFLVQERSRRRVLPR